MKLKFGFVKVRYRRLKNANRLFTPCALVNLFPVRRNVKSSRTRGGRPRCLRFDFMHDVSDTNEPRDDTA